MMVIRRTPGGVLANSEPCGACAKLIQECGLIKHVSFSFTGGVIVKNKTSQLKLTYVSRGDRKLQ